MLHRVTLVRTDVSEDPSPSIIGVTRIGELGTTLIARSVRRLLVTANVPSSLILVALMMEAQDSSKNLFLQEPHSVTSQKTALFILDVQRVGLCSEACNTVKVGGGNRKA
jgi:hypothetical protein